MRSDGTRNTDHAAAATVSGRETDLAELSHLEEALGAAEMGPLPQEALDELNTLYAAEFGGM